MCYVCPDCLVVSHTVTCPRCGTSERTVEMLMDVDEETLEQTREVAEESADWAD